ncbi:MAG: D-alanyl-D-alanine carboxypeptidase [Clostridia bacterium]|nr:D-alanyl-D-alanine carboxypeptidase [Clostridia bacterium]
MKKYMQTSASVQAWTEAKAECVMELNSRRILYAAHADTRLPMASTTKILTAATILEYCDNLREEITIPAEAAGVEGSSVYLKSGDIYTVEDLLYGLMLRSGNDCATALALRFGGSIGGFSAKMNTLAQAAGALESNFENPHGLPCAEHYTTAKDLSYITCYAMQDPVFQKIVATKYYEPRHWQNKNKMLRLYEGGIGVKTGYTKAAGRCLVSAAKRGDMTLVCTLLNCPTTYERTIKLFDDAFAAYQNVLLVKADEPFTLTDGKKTVQCVTEKDFYYPLLQDERSLVEIKAKSVNVKKSEKIVGQLEIYLAKRLLFSANLYKL